MGPEKQSMLEGSETVSPQKTLNSQADDRRRLDRNARLDAQRWKELIEERKSLRADQKPGGQDSSKESGSWSAVSRLAISAAGLALMAAFTFGRLVVFQEGEDFSEL